MKLTSVPVKSWVRLRTAFSQVAALSIGDPRMMLVQGDPGMGKTTAVDMLHCHHVGIYTVASSLWTTKRMLEKLAERLGIRTVARDNAGTILDKILDELTSRPRDLIVIDEFDRIAGKPPVTELLREIYDITNIPIVLVGMTGVEKALSDTPQFSGRIGARVEFRPIDFEDAMSLARGRCEVEVAPELVRQRWNLTKGNIRLLITELAKIEAVALSEGMEAIGLEEMENAA